MNARSPIYVVAAQTLSEYMSTLPTEQKKKRQSGAIAVSSTMQPRGESCTVLKRNATSILLVHNRTLVYIEAYLQ